MINKLAAIAKSIVDIINVIFAIFKVDVDTGIDFNEPEIDALADALNDVYDNAKSLAE